MFLICVVFDKCVATEEVVEFSWNVMAHLTIYTVCTAYLSLGWRGQGVGLTAYPLLAQGLFNPLTPNDSYSGRTATLTSKRCILYIYSRNTGTEYFKHGIYCPFFLFKMQFVL